MALNLNDLMQNPNNLGQVHYVKMTMPTVTRGNLATKQGMVNFYLGKPAGKIQVALGANNAVSIVDDIRDNLFNDSMIQVTKGTEMDLVLTSLTRAPGKAVNQLFNVEWDVNAVNGMSKRVETYMLICFSSASYSEQGYAVSGNDATAVTTNTYPVILRKIGEGFTK